MRIAAVIDEQEQGHAVLMVLTDHGDLILDNKKCHSAMEENWLYPRQA